MSQHENHAMIVTGLAEYYDRVLSPTQLAAYVEDLLRVSPEDLARVVRIYRGDARNDRFPLPAKLLALVDASQSPDDAGREIASKIMGGLSKYGWNNPERARQFIGDQGWAVVQRMGGWTQLCEEITNDNKTIYYAQFRDLAAALSRKDLVAQPERTQIESKNISGLIGQTFKALPVE